MTLEKDKILFLLIFTDILFVFLHVLHKQTSLLPNIFFSIEQDRGYGEFFQYMKEIWIVTLLIYLGFKKRQLLYLSFSLLFLYLLMDDCLKIHERLGGALAENFHLQPTFGLRAKDFGELAVSAFFGALFLSLIGITHCRSDISTRIVSTYLVIMVMMIAFIGVGVDMIHVIADYPVVRPILGVIEDGGEMVMMSVITWFVFRLEG